MIIVVERTKDYVHKWHGYAGTDGGETAEEDEKEVELRAVGEDALLAVSTTCWMSSTGLNSRNSSSWGW